MDIITRDMFDALIDSDASPAVSIYMPTHRVGPEIQQDPIRLKNLLQAARRRLVNSGERVREAEALLRPAFELCDQPSFWQYQEDGLALFLAPDRFDSYRLPAAFRELVVVGETFHVKPLLRVMSRGERFHVLGLSQQRVRLLRATRYRVSEVDISGDVPESLAEALWFEDPERQLQFHQSARQGEGRLTATFHGHGMGKETSRKRLERFFRAVDKGIGQIIEADAPLVLAGVEYLLPIYRRISEHSIIPDGEITGNPEELTEAELHQRAWEIAEPFFRKERDAAAASFATGAHPTETTTEGVLPAAFAGRVATLFVAEDTIEWGVAGPSTPVERHAERKPGDRDLLDLAVAETWRHRGSVYLEPPSQIPGGGVVAAVLRY
ncbi:MAG: hypothetical protein GWP04_06085 [Gammaproteobacteria bacterium]|nr:hypothetical protein [Gammaproteobacteria bacterium]